MNPFDRLRVHPERQREILSAIEGQMKRSRRMKKIIFMVIGLFIFSTLSAHALEATLFAKRNEIFEESKKIKSLLTDSRDVILINSMWDSCILTMTQLDAYFVMLSIFNTIKENDVSAEALDYLVTWLGVIKRTNEVNMKGLGAVSHSIEPDTEVHRAVLKVYFRKLNKLIDVEIKRVTLLKKSQ